VFALYCGDNDDFSDPPFLVAVSPRRATLEDYVLKENARWAVREQVRARVWELLRDLEFPNPYPVKMRLGFTPKTKEEHQAATSASRAYDKAVSDYQVVEKQWRITHQEAALANACKELGLDPVILVTLDLPRHFLFTSVPFTPPTYTIEIVTYWE
jgi:hypothetical protein